MSALIDETDLPVDLPSDGSADVTLNGEVLDSAAVTSAVREGSGRDHPAQVSEHDADGVGPDGPAVGDDVAAVDEIDDDDFADFAADDGPATGDDTQVVQAPFAQDHAQVVQDAPAPTRAQLRIDFGAHLEANYRRLVAQLYAITLDPAEAHSAVQDAYSRAWRSWATVSRTPDPTGWVRRVAVRSTIRSWRRFRWRSRRPVGLGPDTSVGALLAALQRLSPPERRCVVLHHMAGAALPEIAAVEGVSVGTTAARLSRAQQVVNAGLVDVLSDVLGRDDADVLNGWAVPEWDSPHAPAATAGDDQEDQP